MEDHTKVPISLLLRRAVTEGVYLLGHPDGPVGLQVRCHRFASPDGHKLAALLRARRDELYDMVRATRPPAQQMSEEERRFRHDVLREPDIEIADLTWPVLRAMMVAVVRDVLAAERGAALWECQCAGRDDPSPASPPARRPRPTRRREAGRTDRVVF